MKKIIIITLLVILVLSGCKTFPSFNNTNSNAIDEQTDLHNDIKGEDPSNPIPFGEFGQIGETKNQNVQIRITNAYYDEDLLIIEYFINAINVGDRDFSPHSFTLILNNGLTAKNYASIEHNNIKDILTINFATQGSCTACETFEKIELSNCLCLRYYNFTSDKFIYFELPSSPTK